MADFPTTNIRVNSQISPYTDDQVFPLFDSAHGLGGLRTVGTTAEMNAIFDRRRTRGMMVYVSGVSAYYALIGTTANSGWTTEFQIGTGTNILPLNNTFTGTNVFNAGVTFTTDIKVNNVNIGKGPGPSTNLIFGSGALSSNSSGQYNVAIGTSVLGVNTQGEQNIGIGYGTLLGNSSGNSNVAIGHGSATNNTTGSHNTAVGDTSLYDNITGAYNTAIGTASLYNSKGDNNTALGSNSLMGIQTGSQNIAIGSDAGVSIPTGAVMTSATGGIYIGALSKGSTQGRVNEIVIGTQAVGMGSNTAVLGATTQAAAFIYGLVHALGGVSAFGATLSGTVTAPTQTVGTNNTTVATTAFVQNEIIADAVTSFNGRTGAVQGVSAAAAGDGISVSGATGAVTITNTGVTRAAAGTGIFVSANTGTVTITNIGVQSFNGNTGAVTGASLGANTFTGLNIFSAGLSASSGLFGTLQSNSGATFNADVYVGATLSVNGNLVINGTTTTINSTTITVDDKNIELGSVTSPTDTTADGGGISLKGATDKTIVWSNVTSGTTLAAAWNFNQDINLTKSGNPAYYINGTIVIDGASLGPNIVNSNLTKVGTIATGVWQGTIIGGTYGGTGLSSYAKGDILYAAAAGSVLSKLAVSSTQGQLIQADGSGLFAWGDLLIADGSGNGVSTLTSGKYRIQDASTSVKGLSRYDSFNFSVAAGVVGITAIDGGSYT